MLFCTRWCLATQAKAADIAAAFKVLGIVYHSQTCATEAGRLALASDVRKRYRDLARLHHPDLSSGDDNRMKVVNTAYELIQSSGILSQTGAASSSPTPGDSVQKQEAGARFTRKAGSRRRRVPDDFANGDDSVWTLKSSLEWETMMNSGDAITPQELNNPANHPFSHSKFFTFDEDVTVYRMIRGGATVSQVARTLGKLATFVEKRIHNAQFKLRVQYVLRNEKRERERGRTRDSLGSVTPGSAAAARGDSDGAPIAAKPAGRNRCASLLRRSPYPMEGKTTTATSPPFRRKEWEATMPEWRAPQYLTMMSLEEKGRLSKLLAEEKGEDRTPESVASKMGRSYAHYARLKGQKPTSGR